MTSPSDTVPAEPTKLFFVEMLTKDVSLTSAIMDLIDNCVDGAIRLRNQGCLDGLTVDLKVTRDEFTIEDNCGGIEVDAAKKHVFCFGRPRDVEAVAGSVGLFGVGMKRAIFKLGQWFEVKSKSAKDAFTVTVDVQSWLAESRWEFPFSEKVGELVPDGSPGTSVMVRSLYSGVSEQLASNAFKNTLCDEIAIRHQYYIERGLTVRVNNLVVLPSSVKFAHLPGSLDTAFEEIHKNGVAVKLFSGVGEGGPTARRDAGWYVYCNGRMVVRADQTELTGWGSMGTSRIPKYHHQFARFRGCAFFDSLHSPDLPWNTTKDGVDVEAPLYRAVRLRMAAHMRPVITFLNQLDRELDQDDEDKRVLATMLAEASYLPVTSLAEQLEQREFHFERPPAQPRPQATSRINFYRPKTEVDEVKKCLKVQTNREVGERTFDWYYRNECR